LGHLDGADTKLTSKDYVVLEFGICFYPSYVILWWVCCETTE